MEPFQIFSGLIVAGLAGFICSEFFKSRAGVWIFKIIASTSFVSLAYSLNALDTTYGKAIFAALVFSWFGDVFLIPKSDTFFKLGLVSFLIGHLAFCVAFFIRGIDWNYFSCGFVVLLLLSRTISKWLLPKVSADMKAPVIAYMTVITLMVSLAIGSFGLTKIIIIPLGAFIFYLSDISVARDQFVLKEFKNKAWGLPAYYGAQILLGMTVNSSSFF